MHLTIRQKEERSCSMDVLKKVRAATLLETLVASAIILVVFIVGSISINNIFLGTLKNDTYDFDNRLSELEYLSIHRKLTFPYYEDTIKWDISIENNDSHILISALDKESKKEVSRKLSHE